ncbi:MAG: DUF885 family protein [Hyphomonadaceae bacterium]|nr:DUF885 family protein [Hyphomonadaceae bacterium]
MIGRRELLLGGASALAGCVARIPTAGGDADLRAVAARLARAAPADRAGALRRIDAARLSPEGRILHAALLPGAEADAALSRFAWGADGRPYAVTHRAGAYRAAARGEEAARAVEADTERLRADAARGVIAPDFLIDETIAAVEAAIRTAADDPPLTQALRRQFDALRELRARASGEAGTWRLPDGEAWYAQALQLQLGAQADPREAHAQALRRCRDLQAEADALLRAQGLTQGDVAARLRALARDERHLFADSAEGKAAAVAFMNDRLARMRPLLAGAIDGADDAPARVVLLPAAQEADGAGGRRQGSDYLVDLGAIRRRSRWTLPSVVFHELIPGHVLQAHYQGDAILPALQLRYAAGYSEGWATYAEQLADEAGAYADDPLGRIGYVQWTLFRLARVVADTGLHAMRWSRARAVEEMRTLQGDSIAFVRIEDDVARMAAQPGAYAAQGLAAMHIAELRERMRRSVRGFDLPRFHAAVLRRGPLAPPGLDQAAGAAFT